MNTSNSSKPQDVNINILCDADLLNHVDRKCRVAYRGYRANVLAHDLDRDINQPKFWLDD